MVNNRNAEWKLTLLAICYELLLTISFLAETRGLTALKRWVRVAAEYTGNLDAELAALECHIPGLLKVFLDMPRPVRLLAALLLELLIWLVFVKVLLKWDGLRGWGWLAVVTLAIAVPMETAARQLERSIERQEALRNAVNSGSYQKTGNITFYENVAVGLLALVGVLIALELLCTWVSVRREMNTTELLIPVFLLCFWGILLQTAGGGIREARSFFLYMMTGLAACGVCFLLGALRLSLRGCYWLCGSMIAVAVITCFLGKLAPVNGSGAWVRILGVSVQTGELFKIFVVLFAAYAFPYLKEAKLLNTLFYFTCGVLCIALLVENDSGNMMILALLVVMVAFLDDYLVGCALALSTLVGVPVLVRVAAAWGTVEALPLSGAFSHISSRFSGMLTVLEHGNTNRTFRAVLLSILKGGALGTGVAESRSSFFPTYAACADYAFATVLAVWGIAGALGILLALLLLLHNADVPYRYCRRSENYLAGKLATAVLAVQAAVHVGAALNLIPFLGTNLPFVSSGGSSMVTSWMLIGIILSTRTQDAHARKTYDCVHHPKAVRLRERMKATARYAFSRKEAKPNEQMDLAAENRPPKEE